MCVIMIEQNMRTYVSAAAGLQLDDTSVIEDRMMEVRVTHDQPATSHTGEQLIIHFRARLQSVRRRRREARREKGRDDVSE